MLNGTFLESLSTPFSTSNATYHGETWLTLTLNPNPNPKS